MGICNNCKPILWLTVFLGLAGSEMSDLCGRLSAETRRLAHSKIWPVFENDSTALFFYRGAADSVRIAGDWSGRHPLPMGYDSIAGLWFRRETLHPTARVDYKLIVNDEWMLDPRNPRTCAGGFGPNSELAMPRYQAPSEINPRAGVPNGTLSETTLFSRALDERRTVQIYFPAGYESHADLPLALLLDGGEFLALASAQTVLDNLIADRLIEPLIAVFETPHNRMEEYGGKPDEPFERYLLDELLPVIEGSARISKTAGRRAIIGVSLSAAYAAQFAYLHPEQFGCCAAFSPAFWYDGRRIFELFKEGEARSLRVYLDRGAYEGASIAVADSVRDLLLAKGYDFRWNLWYEGHSWGNWRAHLDEALQYFFPAER